MPTPRLNGTLFLAALVLISGAIAKAGPNHASHARKASRPVHSARLRSRVRVVVVHAPTPHLPAPPRIPDAAQLFARSLDADARFSYRGRQITTYWRPGRAIAVIVSHLPPNLRRLDYLAPDRRRGGSLVTSGREERQFNPRRKQLIHRVLAPAAEAATDALESYDLLRANYILAVIPERRTWADRKVFVVTITRKANRALARRLWMDAATGLVLKREIYREDGKLAVTVAFSDINYHPHLTRAIFDLTPLARRPGVRVIEEQAEAETPLALTALGSQLGGAALHPSALDGYRLVSAARTTVDGKPVLHLRYSDGLNLVSLFEQRRTHMSQPTRRPRGSRLVHIGALRAYVSRQHSQTALNWDVDNVNATLMSEIGTAALVKLGGDVRP